MFLHRFRTGFRVNTFLFAVCHFAGVVRRTDPFYRVHIYASFHHGGAYGMKDVSAILRGILSVAHSVFRAPRCLGRVEVRTTGSALRCHFFANLAGHFVRFFLYLYRGFLGSYEVSSSVFRGAFRKRSNGFATGQVRAKRGGHFEYVVGGRVGANRYFGYTCVPPFASSGATLRFFVQRKGCQGHYFEGYVDDISLGHDYCSFAHFIVEDRLSFFFYHPSASHLFVYRLVVGTNGGRFLHLVANGV